MKVTLISGPSIQDPEWLIEAYVTRGDKTMSISHPDIRAAIVKAIETVERVIEIHEAHG